MRIYHVMADGSPGGGPTVVLTLCRQFGALGVDTGVVTQRGSHLQAQCEAEGIAVHGLDFSRRIGSLRLRRELAQLFRAARPDVVHAHGSRSALPVALMARRRRPAFVYTVHGFHYAAKRGLALRAGRLAERFCIARADATVLVGQGDLTTAQHERFRSPSPLQVIYNGVAVPEGLEAPEADRQFDIAFIARLHRQKDPLILPDVLRAMRPMRPSLLIVGGGDLGDELRRRIGEQGLDDQVTWYPAMPREDALARLASARLFLLPSLWEGVPVSLVEAMRLGVAVVASNVAGNAEVIEDGRTGLLAPPGDAAAFADRIGRLLADPALRATLAAAARAHVSGVFSPARQADEHLALYRSVLERRQAAR